MPPLYESISKTFTGDDKSGIFCPGFKILCTYMPITMLVNRHVYFTLGNFLHINQLHLQLVQA